MGNIQFAQIYFPIYIALAKEGIMPIYEYRCPDCSLVSEKISSLNRSHIECPNCGANANRIVSVFAGQTDNKSHQTTGCQPGSGFT